MKTGVVQSDRDTSDKKRVRSQAQTISYSLIDNYSVLSDPQKPGVPLSPAQMRERRTTVP